MSFFSFKTLLKWENEKMSIESVLADNELELMQSKEVKHGKIYAIDTSLHNSYTLDYMLIFVPKELDLSTDTMYSYYTDIVDLFYFYDLFA
jgi:hypothetical protein